MCKGRHGRGVAKSSSARERVTAGKTARSIEIIGLKKRRFDEATSRLASRASIASALFFNTAISHEKLSREEPSGDSVVGEMRVPDGGSARPSAATTPVISGHLGSSWLTRRTFSQTTGLLGRRFGELRALFSDEKIATLNLHYDLLAETWSHAI